MKFVFDTKSGHMVPEDMLSKLYPAPVTQLELTVNAWLEVHVDTIIDNSYSTQAIAREFLTENKEISISNQNAVRDAIAKWQNANRGKIRDKELERSQSKKSSTVSLSYFGMEEAQKYKDLILKELDRKTISKLRNLGGEPGGLDFEAAKLGIDMFDLLKALEGMCHLGLATEIDDSTYLIGASISPAATEASKNRLVSPMKTINLAKVGADGIATSAEEGVDTKGQGKGDCFIQAWDNFYKHIAQHPLLVHGIVIHKVLGTKYNHAWIELGDKVYDTTMSFSAQGVPREIYYTLGNIDDKYSGTSGLLFKYNSQQVSEKALEYQTYGPWEDILWNAEDSK